MPLEQAIYPCASGSLACPRIDNAHIEAINSWFRSAIRALANGIGAFGIGSTVAYLTWVEEQHSRSILLKTRLLVSVTLLLTVPLAFAQKVSTKKTTVEPSQIQTVITQSDTQVDEAIADVLAFTPEMPLGPVEILRQYEDQMTLITQAFSAEMALISQAVHQGQITRNQADYLMQQRFQIAMMQYEVLSALHDSLAFDLSRTPVPPHSPASQAETTVVVQPPFPLP